MKIKDLPLSQAVCFGDDNTEILGVSYDSRKVVKGDVFFALAGRNADGKDFIDEGFQKERPP